MKRRRKRNATRPIIIEACRDVFETHCLSRKKPEYVTNLSKLVDAGQSALTPFMYTGSLFSNEGDSEAELSNSIGIRRVNVKQLSG